MVKFDFRGPQISLFKCQHHYFTPKCLKNTSLHLLHWIGNILTFTRLLEATSLNIFFEIQWEKGPNLYSKWILKNLKCVTNHSKSHRSSLLSPSIRMSQTIYMEILKQTLRKFWKKLRKILAYTFFASLTTYLFVDIGFW